MENRYADIMQLPHPVSQRHAQMSRLDRAAQFAPFAALTGYDGVIRETGRLTMPFIELDEGGMALLDEALQRIREDLDKAPRVSFSCYCPDERKAGGSYCTVTGRVKKLDDIQKAVILTDGRVLPVTRIFGIELL